MITCTTSLESAIKKHLYNEMNQLIPFLTSFSLNKQARYSLLRKIVIGSFCTDHYACYVGMHKTHGFLVKWLYFPEISLCTILSMNEMDSGRSGTTLDPRVQQK